MVRRRWSVHAARRARTDRAPLRRRRERLARRCRRRRQRGRQRAGTHAPSRSTLSTRSSDPPTEGFCWPPSSTQPPSTCSPPHSAQASEPERLAQHGRTLERRPQPLEVARPHRDGTASRRSRGRVRQADETLSASRLEQLDDHGEPLLARPLRHRHLLEDLRRSPRRRRRRHLVLTLRCARSP